MFGSVTKWYEKKNLSLLMRVFHAEVGHDSGRVVAVDNRLAQLIRSVIVARLVVDG